MRIYKHLPAQFNERIEGFGPEFMAIFLSILFIIFMPYAWWVEALMVFFVFYLFTIGAMWVTQTQSIGKRMAKTEILMADHTKPTLIRLHLREITKWALGFLTAGIYFIVAFIIFNTRQDRRSPHDLLFGTEVVFKDTKIT